MGYIFEVEGDKGSIVAKIQTYLKECSFYNYTIDGDHGPKTTAAISAFQTSQSIPVTGTVDTDTFNKLYEIYTQLKQTNSKTAKMQANKYLIGLKWDEVITFPLMNAYKGMVKDSSCYFPKSKVVLWESKFDIDGDGSGPSTSGDTYIGDTSLHDGFGKALNSWEIPFAVLPLDGANFNITKTGIGLGDLGVCIYNDRIIPFIFGDRGPKDKIGEGSIYLAFNLGIPYDPVKGGLQDVPPGVTFMGFINSRDKTNNTTDRTLNQIWNDAFSLYQAATATQDTTRELILCPEPKCLKYEDEEYTEIY